MSVGIRRGLLVNEGTTLQCICRLTLKIGYPRYDHQSEIRKSFINLGRNSLEKHYYGMLAKYDKLTSVKQNSAIVTYFKISILH